MLERNYQPKLLKKLKEMFPGCVIVKNDSSYLPGIPDLTIYYGARWGMLEVKPKDTPPGSPSFRPNQEYYIAMFNEMSFAACVYPSNEQEVLRELQQALQPRRSSRLSKS